MRHLLGEKIRARHGISIERYCQLHCINRSMLNYYFRGHWDLDVARDNAIAAYERRWPGQRASVRAINELPDVQPKD